MCDYSLEFYRSRQAVYDEHYTLHRFGSGTLGFIAEGDCTTAIFGSLKCPSIRSRMFGRGT